MSKRTIRDDKGYTVTIEQDNFMSLKEAEAEVETWWQKNAKVVKPPRHEAAPPGKVERKEKKESGV